MTARPDLFMPKYRHGDTGRYHTVNKKRTEYQKKPESPEKKRDESVKKRGKENKRKTEKKKRKEKREPERKKRRSRSVTGPRTPAPCFIPAGSAARETL